MPLAPNLAARQAMIHDVHPDITIFSIGDPEHQKEASDHNRDGRGIWHALDIMTRTDTAYAGAAKIILAWLLSNVTDLQYVIHDDRIYGRNEANGWKGTPYQPNNPDRDRHKDHIHVSGKHGSVGKNTATGTGYDLAAEAYTPAITLREYMEEIMGMTDTDAGVLAAHKLATGESWGGAAADAATRTDTITNKQIPAMQAQIDAVKAQAAANGAALSSVLSKLDTALAAIAAIATPPAAPLPIGTVELDVTGQLHLTAPTTVATGGTAPGQ